MSPTGYKAQIAVTLLARNQKSAMLTDHVSQRGVFVRTDSPPPLMNLLRMELTLPPSGQRIVLHGIVTSLVPPRSANAVPGVEVTFFAKGGDAGTLWDDFIQHVKDVYPESKDRPVMLARAATDHVRREYPRNPADLPLTVGSGESATQLVATDVSGGGMFIRTDGAFTVGSDLKITLTDPRSDAQFALDCVVRRRVFGSAGGIGVEFRNMTDARRTELDRFLAMTGRLRPLQAHFEEILAPAAPAMMQTLSGACSPLAMVRATPPEDSWASLDEGWA